MGTGTIIVRFVAWSQFAGNIIGEVDFVIEYPLSRSEE